MAIECEPKAKTCSVRALSIATCLPMLECYEYLRAYGLVTGGITGYNLIKALKGLTGSDGEYVRITYKQFVEKYPDGIYFVYDRDHASVIINGQVVDDTYIGSAKKIHRFWKIDLTKRVTYDILLKYNR